MSVSSFDTNLAIVIGIDAYANGITPLRTAVNDARAIAQTLEKEHGYEVISLIDEAANLAALQTLTQETLPARLSDSSRLLLYFAGHGIAQDGDDGPAGYLIPSDATLGIVDSYLPMVELHDALTALPCRHFLAVLDCCFAGAFRWSSTRDISFAPKVIYQERFDRFQRDPAWQVITSAAHDQKALDALSHTAIQTQQTRSLIDNRGEASGQHSPFAAALIRALQGDADAFPPAQPDKRAGDGVITATELYLYLRDSVEIVTEGLSRRQTPEICPLRNHNKGEYFFLTPNHELTLPPAPSLSRENNPYRGLEAFDKSHRDLFFGRDEDVQHLLKRLVDPCPLLVILGASGTGKSSLVRAGLLPDLEKTQDYHTLPVMRPGAMPLQALAVSCVELVPDEPADTIARRFVDNKNAFAELIDKWWQTQAAASSPKTLLFVLDQAEELITQASEVEARQFHELVVAAIASHHQHFRVIATLRLDFEAQFQSTKAYRNIWMDARYVLPPMSQAQLREAIEQPASQRVLYFEPPGLVDTLIEDVAQTPGALPLLSFTLSELYLRYVERGSDNRALTEADYRDLGGVTGALTKRATQEYKALVKRDGAYEQTVKHVMLRMVAVEGGALARRRVPLSELKYKGDDENDRVKCFLKQFIATRLLVRGKETDAQAHEETYIEPAHDALVRGWDKLLRWRNQNQEMLNLQRLVSSSAKAWRNNDSKVSDLWTDNSRLPQLQEVISSEHNWLNAFEQNFTTLSIERKRRRRFRRMSLFLCGITILSSITVLAVIFALVAQERRQVAVSGQLAAHAGFTSRQQSIFLPRSLLLAIQGANQFPKRARAASADVDQALRSYTLLAAESRTFQHSAAVNEANFSANNRWIATVSDDGTFQLWDNQKNQTHLSITHGQPIRDVQFSANNQMVAIGDTQGGVRLWQVNNRKEISLEPNWADGGIYALTFSPDSRRLAIASSDGTARIWEIATGKHTATLRHERERAIIAVSFSTRGDKLLTAGKDKTARVWDVETGKELRRLEHEGLVYDARFNQNDTRIATASNDGVVHVWDIESDEEDKQTFLHNNVVWDVQFSPDGQKLATSSSDRQARIWDLQTARLFRTLEHEGKVWDVRWSPDGSRVATASEDGTARLWEVATGEELLRMIHKSDVSDDRCDGVENFCDVSDVRFSADGQQLLTNGKEGTARLWSANAGKEVARFVHPDMGERLTNVRVSPDGKLLATAGTGNTVAIWDIKRQSLRHQFPHDDGIVEIAFNKTGKYIASGSDDGFVRVWDISTGEKVLEIPHGDVVKYVSFSRDGVYLVTASNDGKARIWNVETRQHVRTVEHGKGIEVGVQYARLSPTNDLLATASADKTACLWKVEDGTQLKCFPHQDQVHEVRFSRDGTVLATAGREHSAMLWDVNTYQAIKPLKHKGIVWDVRFSSDRKLVATTSADGTAKLWNAKTGKFIKTLDHDAAVLEVSFSPAGQQVATVSKDKIVRVWDIEKGYVEVARMSYSSEVWDTRFSPDGEWLATVTIDGIARIHYLSKEKLIEEGCDRLKRNLTHSEWRRYIGADIPYQKTCSDLPEPTDTQPVE
ncbi:MAG: caspase family protein [Cyanobacteria bacterium J06623_4]